MPQKMRVVNSSNYNKLLKERGKVFNIMHSILLSNANNQLKLGKGEPKYSNLFIKNMYAVGYILGLRLRQLCGFFEDYAKQNNIHVDIPDFTTLSRRLKSMDIEIIDKRPKYASNQDVELLIDSTTISIYGGTTHHAKQNAKYRKYFRYDQTRKMHISLNQNSKNVNGFLYTGGTFVDHQGLTPLVEQAVLTNKVISVKADSAYDREPCYKTCYEHEINTIIQPIGPAAIKKHPMFAERNKTIKIIKSFENRDDGVFTWKSQINYGKRSYAETFFSRFKKIFGSRMKNIDENNRKNELLIKCNIINEFNRLGLPKFVLAE